MEYKKKNYNFIKIIESNLNMNNVYINDKRAFTINNNWFIMSGINLVISYNLYFNTNIREGNREIFNIILKSDNNIEINNYIYNIYNTSS